MSPSAVSTDPSLPAAVLWDMDGTIIDTEPYWMAAERDLVASAGGTWTDEQALELVGNELMVSARIILDTTPVTGTPEEIVQAVQSRVEDQLRERMPWRPGAQELLAALGEAGVPCALVTMSYLSLAEILVDTLPEGTFATVVTGDQVARGKPDPEPYLTAAARLGVAPEDCVALEDSPTGTASAVGAGVPTLGIPNIVDIEPRPGLVLIDSLEGVRPDQLRPLATGRRGHVREQP